MFHVSAWVKEQIRLHTYSDTHRLTQFVFEIQGVTDSEALVLECRAEWLF